MAERDSLIPLLNLPKPWALQSGLTPETVLRRLCEWAMVGGFPENAFRDAHDRTIDTYNIYTSYRDLISDNTFPFGSASIQADRAADFLARVLLLSSGLIAFCDKTDTQPFWEQRKGVLHFLTPRRVWTHLAPPPCEEAETHARRREAADTAEGLMNTMERNFVRLRGEDEAHNRLLKSIGEVAGPIDFKQWGDAWDRDKRTVQRTLERWPDVQLASRLERLDEEWTMFRRSNEAGALSTTPPVRLRLLPRDHTVIIRGVTRIMPEKQFKLLECLAEAAVEGKHAKKAIIEKRVWGSDLSKLVREVSDLVRDLRETLSQVADGDLADSINNVARVGYILDVPAVDIVIESDNGDLAPLAAQAAGR